VFLQFVQSDVVLVETLHRVAIDLGQVGAVLLVVVEKDIERPYLGLDRRGLLALAGGKKQKHRDPQSTYRVLGLDHRLRLCRVSALSR